MKIKFIPLLLALLLFSCIGEQGSSDDSNISLENTTRAISFKTTTQTGDVLSKINAYTIVRDFFYESLNNITVNENNEFSIDSPENSYLFFTSNMDEPSSFATLKPGETTLDFLLSRTTDADAIHSETSAPEFFSGAYAPASGALMQGGSVVAMIRSTARLDFDMCRDKRMKVNRIEVSGASMQTRVFLGAKPGSSEKKIGYQRDYNPNMEDIALDQFRLYESDTPVQVSLIGTYNDVDIAVKVTIPTIERNKIYRIRIANAGATVDGSFEVLPWDMGSDIEANPDITKPITIDTDHSAFPENTVVDYEKNSIDVTPLGGDFTLAFKSIAAVSIVSVDGDNDLFEYTMGGSEIIGGELISKCYIKVAPQSNGRLGYVVKLNLKNELQQNSYDQVTINVAPSPNQIMTVTFGDATWMAFNATSPALEDQIYTLNGATVKEMYDSSWLSTIGGLFQCGRIYKYVPWLRGVNNAGSQSALFPWVNRTHVPCPAGFRVPTEKELRQLLPNNQAIPGIYNYNGEEITAALHTSKNEHVSIEGVTGKARYISLTSNTGAVMYIPLAGQKGDKSSSNNPNFGSSFALWTSEYGASGGHAWIVNFAPGTATSGTIANRPQIPAEAYGYLRCIKEK